MAASCLRLGLPSGSGYRR